MRFVTLNLDDEESTALQRLVSDAVGACACQEDPRRAACSECKVLIPIRDTLTRFSMPRGDLRPSGRGLDRSFSGRHDRTGEGDAVADVLSVRRVLVVPSMTTDA